MRLRRAVLLAAGAAFAGACANVIGLSDHRDAIKVLCGPCDTIPDCADRLDEGLSAASDDQVHDWLEEYSKLGCANADCESGLFQCFYSAPGLCVSPEEGGACGRSEECCGFDFDEPDKGAGCCDSGGGAGACCADCKRCADKVEAYANQLPFDEATLCLSQAGAWKDLHACATAGMLINNCKGQCEGGGDVPPTEALCKACLANKCLALFQACGEDAGF